MRPDQTRVSPRLSRWSWLGVLPLPIVLLSMVVLLGVESSVSYERPYLLMGLNVVFSTLVSLFIAYQVGRGFVIQRKLGLLLLGCGVLIWGAAGLVGVAAGLTKGGPGRFDANTLVTIHNSCVWMAAMCHLVGVALSLKPRDPLAGSQRWLTIAYAGSVVIAVVIVVAALSGWLPLFFVPGEGGTLVRQFVLGSAIAMFVLAAILLRLLNGSSAGSFAHWYSLALLLLAAGLGGVLLQKINGSPLSWMGRGTQYLGGIYMLVAAMKSMQNPHAEGITLEQAITKIRQQVGVGIAIAATSVFSAAAVRLVFLQSLGMSIPYITFFPAVMLAAVYGGLWPGLIATALSAILVAYFWIEPVGQLVARSPGDLLGLAIFIGNGIIISLIIRLWHRDQRRAALAEMEARHALERAQDAEALRKSEERYHTLVTMAPILVAEVDRDGKILFINKCSEGFAASTITGSSSYDYIKAEDQQIFRQALATVFSSARPQRLILKGLGDHRMPRWWETILGPVVIDGEVVSAVQVSIDITERKQAEEERRHLRQDWEDIFQAIGQPVMIIDPQHRLLAANRSVLKATGKTLQELQGQKCYQVFHGAAMQAPPFGCPMEAMCASGQMEMREVEVQTLGGSYLISCTPVLDEHGQLQKVIHIATDITERKRIEARLSEVIEGTNVGTWEWDVQTGATVCNERWCNIVGYTMAELAPTSIQTWRELVHPDDLRKSEEQLAQVFSRQRPFYVLECRMKHRNGNWVWIVDRGKVIEWTEDGQPARMAGTHTDVTERKQNEAELLLHREHLEQLVRQRTAELSEARDQAQAANLAKSAFLANMSHELRTPLTAVLGFADLMVRDPAIPERSRGNLAIILRSGKHLLGLINDVLDLAKIDAGRAEVERCDVDLDEVIRNVTTVMQMRAEAKGLRLVLEQTSGIPRLVNTDPGKFSQILVNLVDNAIKFTQAGQITIGMTAEPVPDGHRLTIQVRDPGIGISREDLVRIFLPFEQITGSTLTEGIGLGLAITRQYVQMLGGQISVDSEPGKETCFTFTIPVGRIDPAGALALQALSRPVQFNGRTADLRILIVEDHPENRLLLHCLLEPQGFQLREAVNGEEAVHIFKEWRPHLILMDRRMLVLDGLEATRQIRALPDGNETIIIAISAKAFKSDRQEMLAAGCNDFLVKPFTANDFFPLLQKHLPGIDAG